MHKKIFKFHPTPKQFMLGIVAILAIITVTTSLTLADNEMPAGKVSSESTSIASSFDESTTQNGAKTTDTTATTAPNKQAPASASQNVDAQKKKAATPTACANQIGSATPKGMWAWQYMLATDASQRAAFFEFAGARRVQTVYLESEKLLTSNQTALATFIQEAKQHCMNVELLVGAADWAFTRNHSYAVLLAQKAVTFAASTPVPPAGIHYDVEPYNLDEYQADTNAGANQYLDLLEKIQAVTQPSSLYFAKAMPLGFEFQTVTRGGVAMPLSNATIDRVDRIMLMDYRDTASRVIDDAANEIAYAALKGKKLTIGVETSCDTGEVETITFCEEGATYMETQLAAIQSAYGGRAAFSSIAVHDYAAYKTLRP